MGFPNVNTQHIDCKQGAIRCVRYNVDGNYCMTGGSDRTIKLWNPLTSTALQSYMGHGNDVLDVRSSCDNSNFVSGGSDKSIMYWDVMTAKIVGKYRGHAGAVQAVCFNEESSVMLSGSVDGTVRIWDCRSRSRDPIQILNQPKDAVTSVGVSDHEIVCTSLDNSVRRYDIRLGKLAVDALGNPATRALLTKDGLCVLVSCMNSTVKLLHKKTGELLQEFTGHKNTEYYLDNALSEDDSLVYSGSEDGKLYCWSLLEGTIVTKLEHPLNVPVHSVSHHPTKAILLTATKGQLYIWQEKKDE